MATVVDAVKVDISRLGTDTAYLVYQQNIRLFYERFFDLAVVSPVFLALSVGVLCHLVSSGTGLSGLSAAALLLFVGLLFFVISPAADLWSARAEVIRFETSGALKAAYERRHNESWDREEQKDNLYHTHASNVYCGRYRCLMWLGFRAFF